MDENGQMRTGWIKTNGKNYYFGQDGAMKTGWYNVDNQWYYFYSDGSLATNTIIDGWQIDSNGVATSL